LSSSGIWLAPASRLNSRYHCIPVRMSRIDARFIPPVTWITKTTITGNSAVAGIEPTISAIGESHRLKRGLLVAASAHGSVQPSEIAYATTIRTVEAAVAAGISQTAGGHGVSRTRS